MKIKGRLLLQSMMLVGLACGTGLPARAADMPGNGIYCLQNDPDSNYEMAVFTHLKPKEGALVFAMNVFGRDANFYAYGTANPVAANHWRFTDSDPMFKDNKEMACVIDIKFDAANGSWNLKADDMTPCSANKGARISKFIPPFPTTSLVGPVQDNIIDGSLKEELPGDNLQMMANMGDGTCAAFKKPYKPIQ